MVVNRIIRILNAIVTATVVKLNQVKNDEHIKNVKHLYSRWERIKLAWNTDKAKSRRMHWIEVHIWSTMRDDNKLFFIPYARIFLGIRLKCTLHTTSIIIMHFSSPVECPFTQYLLESISLYPSHHLFYTIFQVPFFLVHNWPALVWHSDKWSCLKCLHPQ